MKLLLNPPYYVFYCLFSFLRASQTNWKEKVVGKRANNYTPYAIFQRNWLAHYVGITIFPLGRKKKILLDSVDDK